MTYEVLARKWRPRLFEDVVGQEHVTRTLRNAISAGRLAHAYLFVGPRGIGKTSLARIFAQAINCETGPTETPCGKCNSCREIAAGSNLDVLEIDGASNNRVEEVRDLRENVKFLPARGRYKIYIIDEVHMLSAAAFNALLKTLEEPPPHVKFIFATTEPQKILPTILSRCQRFDLRRISVADIVERLRTIAGAETISASDEALAAVARAAEGSLRDAVSSLDQLRAFKGDAIEEGDVLSVFGLVSRRTLQTLAGAVFDGDVRHIIETVHQLDTNGKDMQRLLIEMLEHFRNVLVMRYAPDGFDAGDLLDDQIDVLRDQAKRSDPERLLRITDLLVESEPRLRYALSRRTLLETTLIRCARAAVTVSIDQIIERLDAMGVPPPHNTGATWQPSATQMTTPISTPATETQPLRTGAPAPAAVPEPASKKKTDDVTDCAADTCRQLTDHWHEITERAAAMAPMAKSALLDTRPVAFEDGKLTIGLDPEFADDLHRLENTRTQRALQRTLNQHLGSAPSLSFRLMTEQERAAMGARPATNSPANGSPTDSMPATAADDSPQQSLPAAPPLSPRSPAALSKWQDEPLVRNTLEAFQGTIIEVRD